MTFISRILKNLFGVTFEGFNTNVYFSILRMVSTESVTEVLVGMTFHGIIQKIYMPTKHKTCFKILQYPDPKR
jgi:hypothetical protein